MVCQEYSATLLSFAGSGQEPDEPEGQTVVWHLGDVLECEELYEPGVGTLGISFSPVSTLTGYGLKGIVDRQLDRLLHERRGLIGVVGESRGAEAGRQLCEEYARRYGKEVDLFCAVDCVSATGFDAWKRLFPRSWWSRTVHPRPPAKHVYHVVAGEEPSRLFVRDVILDTEEIEIPGHRHGQVLRSPVVLEILTDLFVRHGWRRRSS